jgi:hypothetical protein
MKRCVALAFAGMVLALGTEAIAANKKTEWVSLMDGKSLAGWQASEHLDSWKVEEGAFVSRGDVSHLFYVGDVAKHEFKNFELALEVMTSPGANSGVYVHTKFQDKGFPAAGYELQVINSNPPAETMNNYIEHKMTGSIYAVRNNWRAPVKDNEWFRYRIRVVGKTIQTFINDELICEYAEPENAYRPNDKKLRLLGGGTFALQAHDPASVVRYRNIKVNILPDSAAPPAIASIADRELDELVTQASNDNIPLIDLGLAPPAGAAAEAFWSDARRFGVLPGSVYSPEALARMEKSVLVINDQTQAPDVTVLKSAKAWGLKIAFTSGRETRIDPERLKKRLQAIKAAGLRWGDFWVPGKP